LFDDVIKTRNKADRFWEMGRKYREYDMDQQMLLPPDLREWLPEGHLALFISDLVEMLDLSEILGSYESGDGRGRPPYHPALMLKLLVYGYCTGRVSSRKLEQATHEDVAFRVLSCNTHPDHSVIAEFRERHLEALGSLFLQVLRLCERAGLVKLGQVAIDGTKLKADASKRRSMKYAVMERAERRLEEEVERLLEEAASVDRQEDELYGKGRAFDDQLPEQLKRRRTRLERLREARRELEQEAREAAEAEAARAREKIEAWERERAKRQEEQRGRQRNPGRKPKQVDVEAAKPKEDARYNFTDPDSRLMKQSTGGGFDQAYNAQLAVDAEQQIILACEVVQAGNDQEQLVPMLLAVEQTMGRMPEVALADGGYFSTSAITDERLNGVELYVPPNEKEPDQERLLAMGGAAAEELSAKERMWLKLKSEQGRESYGLRKLVVEPVFGQIKEGRGFRQFSLRGLRKVAGEWRLLCWTHNLLKLFRACKGGQIEMAQMMMAA
jgi:transposase